ncbi:hypothetical protein [Deinococcus alpinitundrae]|uniref:hypothetical protein n=1 Tax=Deinococcus alpinitundrae TaxID=468913 RepID=UPI00137B46E8|nr:hypothetical protein [Deinococcus alpinitundrae]
MTIFWMTSAVAIALIVSGSVTGAVQASSNHKNGDVSGVSQQSLFMSGIKRQMDGRDWLQTH